MPFSNNAGSNGRPNTTHLIEAGGIKDCAVDIEALTEDQREQRTVRILQIITDVECATQHRASPEQRVELADWLVRTSYSIRQIKAAAESVAVTQTYGRPFAREFWFTALAQPLVHPSRIRELCRKAYEKGRSQEREVAEAESEHSGIDAVTQRLLDAEKELMELREERKELMNAITALQREHHALQRRVNAVVETRFYRIGDRLIVEHFREKGQVYYHEQGVGETDIPVTRGRRMPATEFDRRIAEHNLTILIDKDIPRLPGYGHW